MCDTEDYGHNVAAITSLFCQEAGTLQHIQEKCGEELTGEIGLWEVFARAGLVFTQESRTYIEGHDYYWYDAIEAFTDRVMEQMACGKTPNKETLRRLAWESIGENSIPSGVRFQAA